MITIDEIQKLADLARIKVTGEEAASLAPEIDSILEYVGQIKAMNSDEKEKSPQLRNVMRDDVVTHEPSEYTETLLKLAPNREKNYLKVKKILE